MVGDAPWAVAAANLAAAAAVRPAAATAAATAFAATVSQSSQSAEQSGLEIDRDAFLKLLLAQMSNQDPLSPMDSEQFLSQLAQLNTLDQMWRMNENLQAFMSQQQLLQASAMIGRTVQALDDRGGYIEGTVVRVSVRSGVVWVDLGSSTVRLDQITAVS